MGYGLATTAIEGIVAQYGRSWTVKPEGSALAARSLS